MAKDIRRFLGSIETNDDDNDDDDDNSNAKAAKVRETVEHAIVTKKSLNSIYQCLFGAMDERLKQVEWCLKQITTDMAVSKGNNNK